MSVAVSCRPAQVDDAAAIVRLMQDNFDPALLSLMIYGAVGIEAYLRQQMAVDDQLNATQISVACAAEKVVGFVELRSCASTLWLNYIAVDRSMGGHGIGSQLLAYAFQRVQHRGHATFGLDVMETNQVAKAWYEKLGLELVGIHEWWSIPLQKTTEGRSEAAPVWIAEYPQAQTLYQAFGFGQLQVHCGATVYQVGLLGRRWFRVLTAAAASDRQLHQMLQRIDPERRLLAMVDRQTRPSSILEGPDGRLLATGLRMQASWLTVDRHLEERVAERGGDKSWGTRY